ncbi:hypothetical protein C5167_049295 [Papaver somniferum]|uniref:Uncharacterized protein n=1 Tax=Papaver somniferum TaxID=3469 RepID=A0A4Y7KN52_PAPSO|nr:hypothetical protein C5167_049295 [Papaver somniferum]
MNLKKPSWGEGLSSSENDTSSSSTAVVEELVSSLNKQRMYREVTLALKTGLRDASAEFSFLRVRGLLVPVLFQNSFRQPKDEPIPNLDHIFSVEPMRITSPSTDTEIALALRVLEGCCLLHRGSTALAHQFNAIKVLMSILSTRGVLERGACLDAFIAIMLDSSANQMDFEACRGIEKVTKLIKDKQADENIRVSDGCTANKTLQFRGEIGVQEVELELKQSKTPNKILLLDETDYLLGVVLQLVAPILKDANGIALHSRLSLLRCGEFLLLLIGHLNSRERPPKVRVHDEIRRLLGERSASLVWAASQFGSTLDPEQRQTALHIQARRVIESLELEVY